MRLREALAPWALTVVAGCLVGYLFGGVSGLRVGALVAPTLGLLASVLFINYRYWDHPLRFTWGVRGE